MRRAPAILLGSMLLTAGTVARAADPPARVRPDSAATPPVAPETGPNRLLLASGAATLAFGYGGAAWVGATSSLETDRLLLLPLAGPWLALATRAPCDEPSTGVCGHETTYDGLLVADGLVQIAGVVQVALAFLRRDLRRAVEPSLFGGHMRVAPARAAGGLAIAATGTF
jgi:hypothetical protein